MRTRRNPPHRKRTSWRRGSGCPAVIHMRRPLYPSNSTTVIKKPISLVFQSVGVTAMAEARSNSSSMPVHAHTIV